MIISTLSLFVFGGIIEIATNSSRYVFYYINHVAAEKKKKDIEIRMGIKVETVSLFLLSLSLSLSFSLAIDRYDSYLTFPFVHEYIPMALQPFCSVIDKFACNLSVIFVSPFSYITDVLYGALTH